MAVWSSGLGCRPKTAKSESAETVGGVPQVRVRIFADQTNVLLLAAEPPTVRLEPAGEVQPVQFPAGRTVSVSHTRSGWRLGTTNLGDGELVITPPKPGAVSVNGYRYRGRYRLVPVGDGKFDVVNDVSVEAYLKGVLAKELYPDWPEAAYRAQAVAARTYTLYETRTAASGRHFDLHADTRSQMYGGMAGETPKSRKAVEDTAGVVVAYGEPGKERIFKAFYSSCCGGVAQSAAHAFGGEESEPLVGRNVGPRCRKSPRFSWQPVTVSKDDLTSRLRQWGASSKHPVKNTAKVARIEVDQVSDAGRPVRFAVVDERGGRYLLTSEQMRWAVNTGATKDTTLSSGFFTPVDAGNSIRFADGHGFGHGVGMCQWCIRQQAADGVDYEDIVLDAYPGSRLFRAY